MLEVHTAGNQIRRASPAQQHGRVYTTKVVSGPEGEDVADGDTQEMRDEKTRGSKIEEMKKGNPSRFGSKRWLSVCLTD